MLILASTTDKLRLITSAAIPTDVHISWLDNISGAVAPGRTNSAITTSATTDILASPASGTFRSVKTMHIRNKGSAGQMQTVTVLHTDGTTSVELHKQVLSPNDTLQYIDEVGFVLIPDSGIATGSKVLLKSFVPTATTTLVIGPEVLSHTEFDSFELEWRLRPNAAVVDALGYLVSFDNGATYYTSATAYGFAFAYGGTAGTGGGSGAAIAYGYMGANVGTIPSWWCHGRARVDAPYRAGVDHLLVGMSGGFTDSIGVHAVSWCSYPGLHTAITNYQFYWQAAGGAFSTDGYMKVFGIK